MKHFAIIILLALFTTPLVSAQESDAVLIETGSAFFYAEQFEGRRTASGETYRGSRLTGAHRTLPLGSVIRVRNVRNGRTVVLRVNDRGPYVPGRILDISAAAADSLDLDRLVPSEVELYTVTGALPEQTRAAIAVDNRVQKQREEKEKESNRNRFTVQLGSFSDIQAATTVANKVNGAWIQATRVGDRMFFRVNFGVYDTREAAEDSMKELAADGVDGFVKTLDEATS